MALYSARGVSCIYVCIYIFQEYRKPSSPDYTVEVTASIIDDGKGPSKFIHNPKILL